MPHEHEATPSTKHGQLHLEKAMLHANLGTLHSNLGMLSPFAGTPCEGEAGICEE